MANFALVRPDNTVDRRSSSVSPDVQTKPGWRWLPVNESGNSAFDPETQKKTGPVTTVEATRVLDTFTVSSLTAQELSDIKDAKISRIDMLQFAVMFDMENRMRVYEAKPALTAAQYRAALKARL